jgi:hypothetical protein
MERRHVFLGPPDPGNERQGIGGIGGGHGGNQSDASFCPLCFPARAEATKSLSSHANHGPALRPYCSSMTARAPVASS